MPNPNCLLCGQIVAPPRWWRWWPLLHDTPDGECPVITEKRARLETELFVLGHGDTIRAYSARVFESGA